MWNRSRDNIDTLPDDLLAYVFSFLSPFDAVALKVVSFRWLHIARRALRNTRKWATIRAIGKAEPELGRLPSNHWLNSEAEFPESNSLAQLAFKRPEDLVIGLATWRSTELVGEFLHRLPWQVSLCWFELWPSLPRAIDAMIVGMPDLELDDFCDDAEFWSSLDRAASLLVLWWETVGCKDAECDSDDDDGDSFDPCVSGDELVAALASSSCLQSWEDMERAAYYFQAVWGQAVDGSAGPAAARRRYARLLDTTSRWKDPSQAAQFLEHVSHFKPLLPLLLDSFDTGLHDPTLVGRVLGRWVSSAPAAEQDDGDSRDDDGRESDESTDVAIAESDDEGYGRPLPASTPSAASDEPRETSLERRIAVFEYFFDEWPTAAALRETRRSLGLPRPSRLASPDGVDAGGVDDAHPSADWRNLPRVGTLLLSAFGGASHCTYSRILERILAESACTKHVARVMAAWQDAAHDPISDALELESWADQATARDLRLRIEANRALNACQRQQYVERNAAA